MKGRRPKSPELKLLQGSRSRKPKSTGGQLKPTVKKLEPPFFIRDEGLAEWNRVEPELRRVGILTMLDFAALVAYCGAYGRFCKAERLIQEVGLIYTTPSGIQRIHPVVGARNDAESAMIRYAAELGITPSSRGRVTPVDVESDVVNPFALLDGGKKPD